MDMYIYIVAKFWQNCSLQGNYLLPTPRQDHISKKCVVVDLDETLVHSSFKPVSNADFIVPVEIDGTIHQVNSYSYML